MLRVRLEQPRPRPEPPGAAWEGAFCLKLPKSFSGSKSCNLEEAQGSDSHLLLPQGGAGSATVMQSHRPIRARVETWVDPSPITVSAAAQGAPAPTLRVSPRGRCQLQARCCGPMPAAPWSQPGRNRALHVHPASALSSPGHVSSLGPRAAEQGQGRSRPVGRGLAPASRPALLLG